MAMKHYDIPAKPLPLPDFDWRLQEDQDQADFLTRWEEQNEAMQERIATIRAKRAANLPSGWAMIGDVAVPATRRALKRYLRAKAWEILSGAGLLALLALFAVVWLSR